jgi:hypothetical protein
MEMRKRALTLLEGIHDLGLHFLARDLTDIIHAHHIGLGHEPTLVAAFHLGA